jgi:hypothetical protein
MTGKQKRKFARRARIAAVRATQDQWIAEYGLGAPTTRRQRDHRFTAALKLNLILQGIPHVAG